MVLGAAYQPPVIVKETPVSGPSAQVNLSAELLRNVGLHKGLEGSYSVCGIGGTQVIMVLEHGGRRRYRKRRDFDRCSNIK